LPRKFDACADQEKKEREEEKKGGRERVAIGKKKRTEACTEEQKSRSPLTSLKENEDQRLQRRGKTLRWRQKKKGSGLANEHRSGRRSTLPTKETSSLTVLRKKTGENHRPGVGFPQGDVHALGHCDECLLFAPREKGKNGCAQVVGPGSEVLEEESRGPRRGPDATKKNAIRRELVTRALSAGGRREKPGPKTAGGPE